MIQHKYFHLTIILLCLPLLQLVAKEEILLFHSDIKVQADGSFDVIETIRVYAEGRQIKRGIFREIPTTYKNKLGIKKKVRFEVVSVKKNGSKEPYHTKRNDNGVAIYIGQSDVYIPQGEYVYEIHYTTNNQILFMEDLDEVYWNVTGNFWSFPIKEARAKISLPEGGKLIQHAAYIGYEGSTDQNVDIQKIDDRSIEFKSNRSLQPREGLTIAAGFEKGLIPEPTTAEKFDETFQSNKGVFYGLLGLLGIFLYYFINWRRVGVDPPKGTIIPQYYPPENMSAAACRFVEKMSFDNQTYTAALVQQAVNGNMRIEHNGERNYTLKTNQDYTYHKWEGEDKILQPFFGGRINSIKLDKKDHQIFSSSKDRLKEHLSEQYEGFMFNRNRQPLLLGIVCSTLLLFGLLLFVGKGEESIFMCIWLFFWLGGLSIPTFISVRSFLNGDRSGKTIGGLVFAFFFMLPSLVPLYLVTNQNWLMGLIIIAILMVNLIFAYLLEAPTIEGRETMDHIEGFKMYLSTAEKDRLNMLQAPEENLELYEQYLPYAIALGVENEWGERFEKVIQAASQKMQDGRHHSYSPVWYSGSDINNFSAASFGNQLGSSFNSALSSAASSPSSSGGSGGGGSSGGGGGGGGGGGW